MEKQNKQQQKKKLYSRLVLVTSLFPIEIIKQEKLKKKKSPKRDAQADYHEGHSSQRALKESHIFSLLQ